MLPKRIPRRYRTTATTKPTRSPPSFTGCNADYTACLIEGPPSGTAAQQRRTEIGGARELGEEFNWRPFPSHATEGFIRNRKVDPGFDTRSGTVGPASPTSFAVPISRLFSPNAKVVNSPRSTKATGLGRLAERSRTAGLASSNDSRIQGADWLVEHRFTAYVSECRSLLSSTVFTGGHMPQSDLEDRRLRERVSRLFTNLHQKGNLCGRDRNERDPLLYSYSDDPWSAMLS